MTSRADYHKKTKGEHSSQNWKGIRFFTFEGNSKVRASGVNEDIKLLRVGRITNGDRGVISTDSEEATIHWDAVPSSGL